MLISTCLRMKQLLLLSFYDVLSAKQRGAQLAPAQTCSGTYLERWQIFDLVLMS